MKVDAGETIALDGSGSYDPDNGPGLLRYQWKQVGTQTVELVDADKAVCQLRGLAANRGQKLVFELTVRDGADSDSDRVELTIK